MGNFFIGLANHLISGLGIVLSVLTAILPGSPIKAIDNSPVAQYLGCVNWIIPIYDMINELAAFCLAVLIWYAVQIVLRWGKAIE